MEKKKASVFEVVGWSVAYSFASTSMTLVNKAAIRALPFPYWVCLSQNAATLGMALLVANCCAPPGDKRYGFKQPMTMTVVRCWMPALILFVLMLVSSLSALHKTSVPTVLVFRSLTPLLTAILEARFLGMQTSSRVWASLLLILLGALCYLYTDNHFEKIGYLWMLVNLVTASGYHVYVKWIINTIEPSTMDMVYYNNTLSLPLLFVLGLAWDNVAGLPLAMQRLDGLGWVWVVGSCLVAGCIAFTGFGLQGAVSATTATVVNHINKVLSFIASYAIFKDRFNWMMLVGVAITLGGTVWYGNERMAPKPQPPPLPTVSEPGVESGKHSSGTEIPKNGYGTVSTNGSARGEEQVPLRPSS